MTDNQHKGPYLAVETPPEPELTEEQILEMEWEAVHRFRASGKAERQKLARNMVGGISDAAVVAVEIVSLNKAELVEKVGNKLDEFDGMLPELVEARDDLQALYDVMSAATMRLTIALAIAYPDGPGGGGGQPVETDSSEAA